MDGETPSLPDAAQGIGRWDTVPTDGSSPLRPPTKTARPSRVAIPGRDRVLSVLVCLIGPPGERTVRHRPYRWQQPIAAAYQNLAAQQGRHPPVGIESSRSRCASSDRLGNGR